MSKIDPGKGYRLLKIGEIIQREDEHWAYGVGPWVLNREGDPESVGLPVGNHVHPHRRKIESKGWNVTFKSRDLARYAASHIRDLNWDKDAVLKGPHKV